MTGAVVDGCKEFWFLSDCTLPKNANTQITMMSIIFHRTASRLTEMGRSFPTIVRCVSDNASGETKNQAVAKFFAWLVWRRKMKVGEMAQQRVGHTHNRQDARFGTAATVTAKPATIASNPLENIDDF